MSISGIGSGTCAADMREQFFKRLDQDGDGSVTKEEMSSAMPLRGGARNIDDIFERVDSNHDGAVDRSEHDAQMARDLFAASDADGDGSVSESELLAVGKNDHHKSLLKQLFSAADSDGDGSVSESELAAALEQLRPQHFSTTAPSYDSKGDIRNGAGASRLSVEA